MRYISNKLKVEAKEHLQPIPAPCSLILFSFDSICCLAMNPLMNVGNIFKEGREMLHSLEERMLKTRRKKMVAIWLSYINRQSRKCSPRLDYRQYDESKPTTKVSSFQKSLVGVRLTEI